jgi:hypothetical protein
MGPIGYLYLSMLMDARACAKCICIFVFYERICVFIFNERKQREHQRDVRACAWLGISIFGSDFWDLHRKQNSDSVFDSEDSGQIFFMNSAVEKSRKRNSNSEIQNSKKMM